MALASQYYGSSQGGFVRKRERVQPGWLCGGRERFVTMSGICITFLVALADDLFPALKAELSIQGHPWNLRQPWAS